MKPFIFQHTPQKTEDVIGQDKPYSEVIDYIKHYKTQKKKALLLYGPSGTGKTSSIHALGNSLNLEVVEVNASDVRNADSINEIIGGALFQQSLFSTGKIILVDEIDGLAGNKDRGGLQALLKLIAKSSFPIVFTVTNPYDNKFSSLRSKSVMVEYPELDSDAIAQILQSICEKENISFDDSALKTLARRSGGDARAAINNLQMASISEGKVSKEGIDSLSDRDRTESMLVALQKIFKSTDLSVAFPAFQTVQEDIDQQFLWLDENLPKEYTKPEDKARAYHALALADVFRGRIRRWQHYRFYVYIGNLLTGGIAAAKDERYKEFVRYGPTGRLLKIFWANQKGMKKKAIAEKIAQVTHTSVNVARKETLPYLQVMFANKDLQPQFIEAFDLDKEHVEWLKKNTLSV